MLDYKNMTYSDFTQWLDDNSDFVESVLSYDDWSVVRIHDMYFYYDHEQEGSADTFVRVELIAELTYSIIHDLQITDPIILSQMFDNIVCGEEVYDECIKYLWFGEYDEQ